MSKKIEIIEKDELLQAVVVVDDFGEDFIPICNDMSLALLPVGNKPLIEYMLQFLYRGRIQQVYIFCCKHADGIKKYIEDGTKMNEMWSQFMNIDVIVSQNCRSLGDCMRDLDAKGLVRGHFVLLESGAFGNFNLEPIIRKHIETYKKDKGAAMTLVHQDCIPGHYGRSIDEEIVCTANENMRIVSWNKLGYAPDSKMELPWTAFTDNSEVTLTHNVRDIHISICSPSTLSLFSDNFDYQTKDDFVRGILMEDEIMSTTIYHYITSETEHGCCMTNWRMYKVISEDLMNKWFYPLVPKFGIKRPGFLNVMLGENCDIADTVAARHSVIGDNVSIGTHTLIKDSYIFPNVVIEENCDIENSIIGHNAVIKKGCIIRKGSVVGPGVLLRKQGLLENNLVQASRPEDCDDLIRLGSKCYILQHIVEENGNTRVFTKNAPYHFEVEFDTTDSEIHSMCAESPIEGSLVFFTGVVDSLKRGYEENLHCENMILEINSSRYAYNVALREVIFYVVKSILTLSLAEDSTGPPSAQAILRCLVYFSPILKNYINSEEAMEECLAAIKDFAAECDVSNSVVKVLKWLYDKDVLSEESILLWNSTLDESSPLFNDITPFITWLQEAEEESSDNE